MRRFYFLGAVFKTTNRQWEAQEVKTDVFLAPAGRAPDSMLKANTSAKGGWKVICSPDVTD